MIWTLKPAFAKCEDLFTYFTDHCRCNSISISHTISINSYQLKHSFLQVMLRLGSLFGWLCCIPYVGTHLHKALHQRTLPFGTAQATNISNRSLPGQHRLARSRGTSTVMFSHINKGTLIPKSPVALTIATGSSPTLTHITLI